MKADPSEVAASKFEGIFGARPELRVRVPGRVNLIGDHTDYHEGFVLPMAINRGITLHACRRAEHQIRIHSNTLDADLVLNFDTSERHPERWAHYFQGVLRVFGARFPLRAGCDVFIDADLPPGGGLSSSSALVVGFVELISAIQGIALSPLERALLGRDAEHWFGTTGGIMDQFVISHARAGHAVLLDCRSLAYEYIDVPENAAIVVADTGTRHDQIVSPFAERRRQAEAALHVLQSVDPQVSSLRDVAASDLERVRPALLEADPSGILWQRCKHVSTENSRVQAAAWALQRHDLKVAGKLMTESHISLRDDYDVSSPELDSMVEAAWESPYCYGARMTGGGFGGCTVNLVASDAVDSFCETVAIQYARATGIQPSIFATVPSDGVQAVQLGGAD
jgi:galactokinase